MFWIYGHATVTIFADSAAEDTKGMLEICTLTEDQPVLYASATGRMEITLLRDLSSSLW